MSPSPEPPGASGPGPGSLPGADAGGAGPRPLATARRDAGRALSAARAWLTVPGNARRAAWAVLPVLVAAVLLLPPLSLASRLASPGYARIRPGFDVSVPAAGDVPAALEIRRPDIARTSRARLGARDRLPRGVDPLPAGRAALLPALTLDFRGPPPRVAQLLARLPIDADEQPFVDAFGWDGERWRWLATSFASPSRARVRLPLAEFVPRVVVVTRADAGMPEVGATMAEPPVSVPAAAAELGQVEARALRLADDRGRLTRLPELALPAGRRRFGVLDNRDGPRVRDDLLANVLIQPDVRRRHRAEIVRQARRAGLDGVVLDYQRVPDDLKGPFVAWVGALAADLHAHELALVVMVDMPRRTDDGWDGDGLDWRVLGDVADGVRVRLPVAEPLETRVLDEMVRWALGQVDRRRIELAVPVYGRDVVDGDVTPIDFGTALAHVLDMARSDAPAQIPPGREATVELPTVAAAELGRDPATGMWRFYYWDANRRQHTVWLNDAAGLRPAFDVATRYHLGRVALDGVSATIDPQVWRMVETFVADGRARVAAPSYRLAWRLLDDDGRVIQEALQPLDAAAFTLRAPSEEGAFRLTVDLVLDDGTPAAFGRPMAVAVAPPPPPTATPTPIAFRDLPTPEAYETAPPPPDEVGPTRAPVTIGGTAGAAASDYDGEITAAETPLRAEPALGARVVSDLRLGDRLAFLDISADGRWRRVVVVSTGLEGWVWADFVSARAPDADLRRAPGARTETGTPVATRPPAPGRIPAAETARAATATAAAP